jgi:hypothetical protein
LSQLDSLRIVDVESGNRRPPGLCSTDLHCSRPLEVPLSRLPPWIEEADNVANERIATG